MAKEVLMISSDTNVIDFLPFMGWFGYYKDVEKKAMMLQVKRDAFIKKLIQEYQRTEFNGSSCVDGEDGEKKIMVQILLSFQKQEPEYYTDEMIGNLLLVLFHSGSDTSVATLEWAFSLLPDHPHVLAKAQAEIDNVVGKECLINESHVSQLPYLHCIINETLRLYPPAPLLMPHQSSKDCTVGGYRVPKGTILLINVWDIHYNPKFWKEPEKFTPERFWVFDGGKNDFKFLPFGFGRRAYPGEVLALHSVSLALGSLIQCFDWEKVNEIDRCEAIGIFAHKIEPLTSKCYPHAFLNKLLSSI